MSSATDNRMRFMVSGYAKFHWMIHENSFDLLYCNKQTKCTTYLESCVKNNIRTYWFDLEIIRYQSTCLITP